MAQRTFTLTLSTTDFGGSAIANAPCSFQPLVSGGTEAIDGAGKFVQTAPVAFRTDGSGAASVIIDYPGDFQSPYVNTQVRVFVNGVAVDSPIGFSYASSIDLTAWISAPITTGLVVMRAVYTKDDNTPIAGATAHVTLSDNAIVTATGQLLSANVPVDAVSDSSGTFSFSLNPNSLLNPTGLGYSLTIDGENTIWSFPCPAVVDVYRGAWNSGTAYAAASGSSNGDVVVDSGGILYRCILGHTNHVPPNATYWAVVVGLPTDLISAHLTQIVSNGGVVIGTIGVSACPNLAHVSGDPINPAATLDDDLVNLAYRIAHVSGGSGSVHVVYTSATCISDADLSQGSSTFGTDNTAPLQALLDLANTAPLLVIWDGKYSTTGLMLHDNTTILGLAGCGAILRSGAQKPVFANDTPSWPTTGIATTNKNITLEGLIINGNGAGQTRLVSGQGYLSALRLWGVANLHLNNLTVLNPCFFAIHLVNCRWVYSNQVRIDVGVTSGTNYGYDGWHINGPAANIYVDNCSVSSYDDALALNADDGPVLDITGVAQGYGPITDVHFTNITFDNAWLGIRVLSGGSRVDRVRFSGLRGILTGRLFVLGPFTGPITQTGTGDIGTVTIEDVDVVTGNNQGDGENVVRGTVACFRLARIDTTNMYGGWPLVSLSDASNPAALALLELDGINAPSISRLVNVSVGSLTSLRASGIHGNVSNVLFAFGTCTLADMTLSNYFGDTTIYTGATPTILAGDAFSGVTTVQIDHNGTLVGTRAKLNFIDGSGTTLTVADNSGAGRVDVTIATVGSGGVAFSPLVDPATPDFIWDPSGDVIVGPE